MADLVRSDGFPVGHVSALIFRRAMLTPFQGARVFYGPDGLQYRWRPSPNGHDILVRSSNLRKGPEPLIGHKLEDGGGHVVALFRPTRPTRYQIGDVYGELHFYRNAGAATIVRFPCK